MTTEATTQPESPSRVKKANGSATSTRAVQTMVHDVRGAIQGMGRSMPDVARASRSAIDDLFKVIEAGPDERVTAGVSMSLGLALGMLIGGAPRLLIALALAPVVASGLVLADRRTKAGRAST